MEDPGWRGDGAEVNEGLKHVQQMCSKMWDEGSRVFGMEGSMTYGRKELQQIPGLGMKSQILGMKGSNSSG